MADTKSAVADNTRVAKKGKKKPPSKLMKAFRRAKSVLNFIGNPAGAVAKAADESKDFGKKKSQVKPKMVIKSRMETKKDSTRAMKKAKNKKMKKAKLLVKE